MVSLGIYLFDDVEVLDFAGPFEVFSTAERLHRRDHPDGDVLFRVATISESGGPIRARGGLVVQPDYSFQDAPQLDLLLVPGGVVTRELERPVVVEWIRTRPAQIKASVCTGAFLLGRAGLLEGRRVVTHWEDLEDLKALLPGVRVQGEARWIDEGEVVTSAGISAGLDMSLHLVERLVGLEQAQRTARQMDYEWNRSPGPRS
jgi:transcriptional regulator GlxA family with amidase domain